MSALELANEHATYIMLAEPEEQWMFFRSFTISRQLTPEVVVPPKSSYNNSPTQIDAE